MPRVYEAKAAKDYPEHDIKKGDTYFHWSFFRGRKQMSKTRPRLSQITGSSKLATLYAVQEALEDALNAAECIDDIIAALQDACDGAESSIDEYNEAIDNLNEGFPNGCPQLEETESTRDNIEAWKDELESAISEVENLNANDYLDETERKIACKDELEQKLDRVPTEEEIDDAYGELQVDSYDDLSSDEQEMMLSDAQDIANGPSLEA